MRERMSSIRVRTTAGAVLVAGVSLALAGDHDGHDPSAVVARERAVGSDVAGPDVRR